LGIGGEYFYDKLKKGLGLEIKDRGNDEYSKFEEC
jgi:hypothetical protein